MLPEGSGPIRVAVLLDYPEEGWTSMDLVGSMIVEHLSQVSGMEAWAVAPSFRRRFGGSKLGHNADRMVNRHVDYPRFARGLARSGRFDLYHVVDHSYAHVVPSLPRGRVVTTCHDLDAFRCLFVPEVEPRPAWFRSLARRTLRGLAKSGFVTADSDATRFSLIDRGVISPDRVRTIHLGTHPECSAVADAEADKAVDRLLGPANPDVITMLHVGSNISRKRIDVLLGTFAGVLKVHPRARLVKVGGALTAEQGGMAEALGVAGSIAVLPPFSPTSSRDRSLLAAVYRRSTIVLQPSEAEGFGLPVAEAMACGSPVLASDLAVLREVAGESAIYRPVGDVDGWVEAALAMIAGRGSDEMRSRRVIGLGRASRYGWKIHAEELARVYRKLLGLERSGSLG